MKVNTKIFVWKEKIISIWQNFGKCAGEIDICPEVGGDRRGKCSWVKTKPANQPNKQK